MIGTPFLLGPVEKAALEDLRERAEKCPVNMDGLTERLKNPRRKRAHMRWMTEQTIELPFGYLVTFSIERNHPGGTARHMSMSSPASGRVPRPEALWMVAEVLGFVGSLDQCQGIWQEQLQGHGVEINVVQLVTVTAPAGDRLQ